MKRESQTDEGNAFIAAEGYDPREFKALTFHDATHGFRDGSDTPRAYLEACLETIEERDPVVRAFVTLNEAGAREAADASTEPTSRRLAMGAAMAAAARNTAACRRNDDSSNIGTHRFWAVLNTLARQRAAVRAVEFAFSLAWIANSWKELLFWDSTGHQIC